MDIRTAITPLQFIVGKENVRTQELMSEHTTFDIGGPADVYVIPHTIEEVAEVVSFTHRESLPLRVIGYGSDLLVADEGLHCIVMQINKNLSEIEVKGTTVYAQAGASNGAVARAALAAGLTGYEPESGIPGTIGGAAIMNAGAYGGEFKDVAVSLQCVNPEGKIVEVTAEEADWSYRHSMMNDAGYVVLSATLSLAHGDSHEIAAVMDDLKQKREDKQPLDMPSAGSTFKRPKGYFAGKLIQDAGLRGYSVGGAQVSEKHTGFVINTGGATAADVMNLIKEVQRRVHEQFGVLLEPEVRIWK